ncbi:MAG: xanthine dehydrogenase family protein molybdopterin-binding subunit [Chloroflexi bacterium]|nr:xanthine dehydrogenase family protein molybdopterin-binding subunit [Chloroflexota bacterium]
MVTIGKSVIRVDVKDKVKGKALYPADINLPDQTYMKILFSGRPHAVIRAIDTTAAEAVPGVLAVLTAKDVPVNEYGLGTNDQPVLCGPGSSKPFADRVRYVGDNVALVVAETEQIAAEACQKITVDYEDLPLVDSIESALKDDPVLLHPDRDSNIFLQYQIQHGDVESAFRDCDVIVEGEYRTPMQEHAYLQPEAGISYIDEEGRVTVVVAGQWTHEDRKQIAHALDLPIEQVRVIYPAIGGAFGGREDMSVQIVLALAAKHLQDREISRPVKIVWSREESIIGHHKRHAYKLVAKWGATSDGRIIAAQVDVTADGGAYVYTSNKVLGNATLMSVGPYEIPNVLVNSRAVYTNNVPAGAFRGFGGPQGAFEAEMQVNRLAEALRMDPVELRMRNLIEDDSILCTNIKPPKGVTIKPVVEACAVKAGWEKTGEGWQTPPKMASVKHIKRGRGMACAFKNIGFSFGAKETCHAKIELHGETEIERVVLYHAAAEVGQGTHTVVNQFAAETLRVPYEMIENVFSDTALTGDAGSVSASRMTFMAGNAVIGAAKLAKEKWVAGERPAIGEYVYRAPATTPLAPITGEGDPNISYGYVSDVVELEVDTETGEVHLLKIYCADDVGKAINPVQVVGQIEGALVQATGYVILENFIQKDGYVQTSLLSNYLIPTVLDIPDEIDSIVLEYAEPNGPYGARGMAEMPLLPLAPAVMHALYDATGVWFNEFPLTPERVLRGLGKIK